MQHIDFKNEGQAQLLESWKSDRNNKLVEQAVELSERYSATNHYLAHNWMEFFRCTLAFDPNARIMDFGHLLHLLNPLQ